MAVSTIWMLETAVVQIEYMTVSRIDEKMQKIALRALDYLDEHWDEYARDPALFERMIAALARLRWQSQCVYEMPHDKHNPGLRADLLLHHRLSREVTDGG